MVCRENGKPSQTKWRVLGSKDGKTRLALKPITGRTHQLRVHCAHPEGLGLPMIGDELYGIAGERLHLHAQQLEFTHPTKKERISLTTPIPF